MRALYDARVSDLGPGDMVVVECGCGHVETLTASMLTTAGVAPYSKVQDLAGGYLRGPRALLMLVIIALTGCEPGFTRF